MALALIVFDFDGVILESVDAKAEAFAKVAEPFGKKAQDELNLYHKLHGGVSRVEKFEWLYQTFVGRPASDAEIKKLCQQFVDYAIDSVLNAPMVPGALEILARWHGKVPMVVCSGTPHDELHRVVEAHGLTHFFTKLYGTPPAKEALLRQAVHDAQVDPAEVVMVGDSSTDLDAAEAVGTLFYGRGKQYAGTAWPWGHDLTELDTWLQGQAAI